MDGDLALKLVIDKHQASGGTYKLILIDYQMPEQSGPEAAKSIIKFLDDRQVPASKRPYFCCFSANQDSDFIKRALEAGMGEFIEKCPDQAKLERLLIKAHILPSSTQ